MNIVTTADSKFAHCLKELAKSVRKYYGKPLIIYDLGLTEDDKKQIDAEIIPFRVDDEVNYRGSAYLSPDGHESTRATHKPFCVRHYYENYNEPMILVDADCLFTERVELTGFDFGITYAPPRKNKKVVYYNGRFNSGVMFFNTPMFGLIDKWEKDNLKHNYATTFVDHNNADKNYEDLRLMSQCKHHIVANSSFSWWGAWLNENKSKLVFAPKIWMAKYKDASEEIVLDSWIKIDN